ncbi:MAG: hypothetical protein ACJ8F1_02095 [Polyangia bacterium]
MAAAESAAAAEPVILLQPTTASSGVRHSLARIRDELSADRFRVVVADSGTSGETGTLVDQAARDGDDGTTLALFGDPEAGEAELCIVRRAAGRTAVRWATVAVDDPAQMQAVLAARALELVRATALELSIDSERAPLPQKPPEPGPTVDGSPFASPATAREEHIVVATMGVGIWSSIQGPPAAVVPIGRIGVRLSDRGWARVSVAGLGSRPRVDTAEGSASVSQNAALAEIAAVLRPYRRLHPMLSFGAGVLNVAVVGVGTAPYEGREARQWSAAFDAGVGVALAVWSRAALVTEVHALIASPRPVVRIADTNTATIGFPSLIYTLALQVDL